MEVTIKETVFCDGSGHGNRMKGKRRRKERIYANEWWTKLMHVYAFYDVLAT